MLASTKTGGDARGVGLHAGFKQPSQRVGEQSRFLGHALDIQQKLERSRRLVCCGL